MPENDDQTPEGTNTDGDQEPSFDDLLKRAMHTIGAAKDDDAAEDFAAAYTSPADLLGSDVEDDLATIRETNPTVADALDGFRKQAQEAHERAQEVEEKETRDTRKDVLRALPANERVAEDDTDRVLIEEIEHEEFLESPAGRVVERATEETEQVKELLTRIKTGKVDFEEGYEKVQEHALGRRPGKHPQVEHSAWSFSFPRKASPRP